MLLVAIFVFVTNFVAVQARFCFLVAVMKSAGVAVGAGAGAGPRAALAVTGTVGAEKHLVIALAMTISTGFAQALDFCE